MYHRKAFTLIELLVVIAIIAILAAILFPVFAQAKMAAKKAVSISNDKQMVLAAVMYSGDNDDMFPKNAYADIGTSIVSPAGNTITNPERTWVYSVQPYAKNWQIFRDPGNQIDAFGCWAAASTACGWYYNWDRWPNYGMNTDYLNPSSCANWGSNPAYVDGFGDPISTTAVASPSDTVYITTTKVVGDSTGYYQSIDSESPGAVTDPNTSICDWTNGGWGAGSYGDTPGLYPNNPTYTGTYSTAYANGGVTGFVDGSVRYMPPGRLAAGTNWAVGITNTSVGITDYTQYLWDTQQ